MPVRQHTVAGIQSIGEVRHINATKNRIPGLVSELDINMPQRRCIRRRMPVRDPFCPIGRRRTSRQEVDQIRVVRCRPADRNRDPRLRSHDLAQAEKVHQSLRRRAGIGARCRRYIVLTLQGSLHMSPKQRVSPVRQCLTQLVIPESQRAGVNRCQAGYHFIPIRRCIGGI